MEFFKILMQAWDQPMVFLSDGVECLIIWFGSREWGRILLNLLPIAILVTCIVVLIALGKRPSKKELASYYLNGASSSTSSLAADPFRKLCYSRVLQLEPSNPIARFHIALDLHSGGAIGKAKWMMQPLAKSDTLAEEILVPYADWVQTNRMMGNLDRVSRALEEKIKGRRIRLSLQNSVDHSPPF